MENIKVTPRMFSPPYGDGIGMSRNQANYIMLSPPYGDGIEEKKAAFVAQLLSPPYGDGILNISQNIAKLKSQRVEKCSHYYDESNLG